MKPSVYLAGPISGLTYGDCTDWRIAVARDLAAAGIESYSPMRAKAYLANVGVLTPTIPNAPNVLSSHRGIMARDRFDATRCSVLFVNLLGAVTPSLGTTMEIAWADLSRIPIVCAIEPTGNPHEHGMILEAIDFKVASLEEAVHVTKAILATEVAA